MNWIAYYRVSSQRQGQSGLGLESQRELVANFARSRGATVVGEYVEVESGRRVNRPQLAAALAEARLSGAAICVAKLDRLARDAEFILRLAREAENNGLGGFLFADLPDVDATTAAGRLILTVMASVAEFEARRASERMKNALAVAKERGNPVGNHLPAVAAANEAKTARAVHHAQTLRGIVMPLRAQGQTLQQMAEALTASGVPTTAEGTRSKWNAATVRRVLLRLEAAS